jgi:transcriptional regulator with XRE-family HTH domain
VINWGFVIKRLRVEKGLTQEELAEKVGISRSLLSRYEIGDVEAVTQERLNKLATALEMTLEQLTQEIYGKPSDTAQNASRLPLGKTQVEVYQVPVYTQFPFHAGDDAVEPCEHIYREMPKAAKNHIEGYIVRGTCLTPVVNDGDTIIVDREAPVENGDIVACMLNNELHIARLKRYDGELPRLSRWSGGCRVRGFWVLLGIICLVLGIIVFIANCYPQGEVYLTGGVVEDQLGHGALEKALTPSPSYNPGWVRFFQDHSDIIAAISIIGALVSLFKLTRPEWGMR